MEHVEIYIGECSSMWNGSYNSESILLHLITNTWSWIVFPAANCSAPYLSCPLPTCPAPVLPALPSANCSFSGQVSHQIFDLNVTNMTKVGFLRLSYEKQDTLLKLLILSMAAVLCKTSSHKCLFFLTTSTKLKMNCCPFQPSPPDFFLFWGLKASSMNLIREWYQHRCVHHQGIDDVH